MFDYCQLDFTQQVEAEITKTSMNKNKSDVGKQVHQLHRDSKSNIKQWKKRLTEDEINRIKEGMDKTASHFYNNEDW